MDFGWSREERLLAEELVEEIASWQLSPGERGRSFTAAEWSLCGKAGLLGWAMPTEYGGRGMGALSTANAFETMGFACSDTGLAFSAAAHLLACGMPIAEFGSPEMKETCLPRLSSGQWVGANGVTEEQAGSDVFSLSTTAERCDDGYVLNGRKSFVSNGPAADVFVIYARTDPSLGALGISAFVVPKGTHGLIVGPPQEKVGLHSCPAGYVDLVECRVGRENLLGPEGAGMSIFKRTMQWERSCLTAIYLGTAKRLLSLTSDHCAARKQFDRPLAQHQAVAHTLARLHVRLEAGRLLVYRACWLLDQGDKSLTPASMAKVSVSQLALDVSTTATHLFGSLGIWGNSPLGHSVVDALPASLFSGSTEMQYDIISSELGITQAEPIRIDHDRAF
ncbi:acyl-CoA dehydrogenase family protein [Streptomyces sp. DH37]|uniref:acyl-CoA dehydrogenase family protein n=1 Tax=Streptomyces sp. DH37 TaxID=3040122 RepID=UPI0024436314|nr:acyl-CoA dehydrogenase family protein [Streptomyces sp. DH37]MDG9702873.1 acyl-CoA dehydrogenase family protein [Streptomyces sp. DH37]